MSQPADRLDKIDAPQFGTTLDRRSLFSTVPPGSMIRQPGPYIQPQLHVTGDWTLYFGRNQAAAPNLEAYDDRILIEISIGTGQSSLTYLEIPELPGVGTAIHFGTEVVQAYLSWLNPALITNLQPTDKLTSWGAPGRPQTTNVKQRFTAVAPLPALPLLPPFVVANSSRIPMFSTTVALRQPAFTPSSVFIPTLAIFSDIGGNVIDMHVCDPTAAGVTTTLTIPTKASLFMMGNISEESLNFWQADWTVIA